MRDWTPRYKHARIPSHLHQMNIDDVQPRDDIREFRGLVEAVRCWVPHHEGRGLTIHGSVGTGKTTMAGMVAMTQIRAELSASGQDALYVHATDLIDAFKPRDDELSDWDSRPLDTRIANALLLVIDDLGTEYRTDFALSVVDRLISLRYDRQRSTVVTTNLTPSELHKVYGLRVSDRLRETNQAFEIVGPSYRRRP